MQKEDFVVYALMFNPTGKLYIGSSVDVRKRYKQHISKLRNGQHESKELQSDYGEYGEDFSIYILEEIKQGRTRVYWGTREISKVRSREYEWMKRYKTTENGYNLQDRQALKSIELSSENGFPLKEGLPPLPEQ